MPCVTRLSPLLLSVLLAVAPVTALLKTWGRSLSLDAPSDWTGGRLPCAGQVALMDDPLTVYLHKHLEARMMVLPSDGEVIFGEGASISLVDGSSSGDGGCQAAGGSTVLFGGQGARWLDANSWHQAALPSPVPHAERVPCSSGADSVLFPEAITYRARVERPVTVSALTVGDHVMNNDRFRAFQNSSVGRSLFRVRDKFNITDISRSCGAEGCVCSNDRPEVLSEICAATSCAPAPCGGAVQPAGHCCPMCGAFVRVTSTGGRLQPSELRRLVGQLSESPSSRVRWHVSLTHDRQLQTVLVDAAAERQDSRRLAETLLDKLTGTSQYGVTGSVMRASGPRHAALVAGGGGGRSAAGPVLAVLSFLVVAGLLVWAVKTKRVSVPSVGPLRLPPPPSQWRLAERASSLAGQLPNLRRRLVGAATAPFHFARFRNSTCGSEVELGQRAEELQSGDRDAVESSGPSPADQIGPPEEPADTSTPAEPARSFDNPMFGSTKLDDNVPSTLLAPTSALCVTPDGKSVANPFFGVPLITVAEETLKERATTAGSPPDEPTTQGEDPAPSEGADPTPGQQPQQQQRPWTDERELLVDDQDSDPE